MVYGALGDKDQALTWLERDFEDRSNPGVLLGPGFDSLRSDPRFQTLSVVLDFSCKTDAGGHAWGAFRSLTCACLMLANLYWQEINSRL
jgi:hypothetical protein